MTSKLGCVIVVCMLVRKQILLEEKQVYELEKLIAMHDMSFSEAMRVGANLVIKKVRIDKGKQIKKLTGVEFMHNQAKKSVSGPGDSEYDKYAYDF